MPTSGDYTMRAQPRRRAAEDKEEPVFLRKTFDMICACDRELLDKENNSLEAAEVAAVGDKRTGGSSSSSSSKVANVADIGGGRLACWSQTGETFIVKDPILFSSEVIPRFFKREFFYLVF